MPSGDYPAPYAWPYGIMTPWYQPPRPSYMLGGWQCPGCGRCWSPSVISCMACEPQDEPPAVLPVTRVNTGAVLALTPCRPSCEGGLCGCGEADDEVPGDCTRARCDC